MNQSILQWDEEFLISIYVDNLLLAACTIKDIDWIKIILQLKFKMIDLNEAQIIIELQIIWDWARQTLWINQKAYVQTILEGEEMTNC